MFLLPEYFMKATRKALRQLIMSYCCFFTQKKKVLNEKNLSECAWLFLYHPVLPAQAVTAVVS